MHFSLTTLGTASAHPVLDKNSSAHLLEVGGRLFLIDCGEGVQTQIFKMKKSITRIDNIFISHLHGDHVFGLFGFLYTCDLQGRVAPLHIYCPSGLKEVIDMIETKFGKVRFPIEYHFLRCKEPIMILEFKSLEIYAFPLKHRVETYGFLFKGKWRDNPRSFAYCSDTIPFAKLKTWLKGVSLIYHEATYSREHKELAKKRYHSTSEDAALLAKEVGAKKLLLGHFSHRYKDLNVILNEAKEIFQESYLAEDGMVFDVP